VGVGLAVGGAAGRAAVREGGIPGALSDAEISAKISDLWFRHDFSMFSKINLTVDQGRVLLTGVVQKQEHRVEAVRLAWQAEGVRQVINEIKVADSEGIKGWARDSWITSRLSAALLFDKDIQSVNYSIDTVQSTVYLMGIAQNQDEVNRVMAHARSVPYVKNVVSYVKMAGVPLNQVITQQGGQQYGAPGSPAPVGVQHLAPLSQQPVQQMPRQPYTTMQTQTTTQTETTMPGDYVLPNPVSPPPMQSQGVPGRPAPIVDQGF
jgi:osmotically-inducible protein OsmY